MPQYKEITKAKQLLVDGDDAVGFFSAFLYHLGMLQLIQVQNYGGNDELRGFLKQFRRASGFKVIVESLGIVRDAETNPNAAFQSVRSALHASDLPVPQQPLEITNPQPSTSVLILPDPQSNGMIETVCLHSVGDDPATPCVNGYFECLNEHLESGPRNLEKARLQVFLASRRRVPRKLGLAARQGVWPWDSHVFDNIRHFLNAL